MIIEVYKPTTSQEIKKGKCSQQYYNILWPSINYWCAKPRIWHETETESETNKGFVNETETESFEVKDSKPKPNPKPIRNFDEKGFLNLNHSSWPYFNLNDIP